MQFGDTETWLPTPSDWCKRQRRAGQLLMGELQEVGIPGLTHKPRMCWGKESISICSWVHTGEPTVEGIGSSNILHQRETQGTAGSHDGTGIGDGMWKRKAVRDLSILWRNRKVVFRDGNRVSPKDLEMPPMSKSQYNPLPFNSEHHGSDDCFLSVAL